MSLQDLTKDELYELASQKDIAGRSEMSKDELLAALEKEAAERSKEPEVADGEREPTDGVVNQPADGGAGTEAPTGDPITGTTPPPEAA